MRTLERMLLRGLVLGVAVAAVLAAPAFAGTYVVYSCTGPDGRGSPRDAWIPEGGGGYAGSVESCASGGGLYGYLGANIDQPVGVSAIWHFAAPADTTIAAYRIWRSTRLAPSSFNATPIYTFQWPGNVYGPDTKEQCRDFETPCRALGDPAHPLAAGNLIASSGMAGVRNLYFAVGCGGIAGQVCSSSTTPPGDRTAEFHVHAAEITLEDDVQPTYTSPPTGPLIQPGATLAGTQGFSFAGSDRGGGLSAIVVEVDGRAAYEQPINPGGRCVKPFRVVQPCAAQAGDSVSFDTAALPDGPHSLRILLRDATESNQAVFGPFTIATANAQNSCGATGGSVSAGFPRRRGRSVTMRYAARRTIRGQVVDAAGAPVAGAAVHLLSTVRRTGAATKVGRTPIVTRADGRFSYRIPKGPSRLLRFGWRTSSQAMQLVCSTELRVNVRAPVSLSVSRRIVRAGHRVRLCGRLRGGYRPARGKLVDLQAFDDGRWRPIDSVRARKHGRFGLTYRFSAGARGRFPIRARVRPDPSYPFTLGYSRVVSVRVG